jgi:Tol biopolymer transport system component
MYLATLDGSQKELLDSQIPYEFFELGPVVSPDGQWVAYLHISGSEEKAALTIIRTDASGRREVFSGMTSLGEGLAPAGLPLVWLPAPEP